jgi:GAF domain-containing protein
VPVDIDVDPLRLKAALRDFVALSAIPAVSVGREPEAVAAGLADSLVDVLQLDFAFVRMSDPDGGAAIEVTRGSARTNFRESLESHVSPISSGASHEVVLDVGDGSRPCHGIAISIGVNGKGGLVVVESKRSDFPSAIDRVLLSLAANHAAIAFENARLIHERDQAEEGLRKARDELEATVVERTAELNAANEELNALRRVATLVAQEASQSDVFSAIAQEIALLLGFREIRLVRYDDDSAVVVAAWGSAEDVFPVGAAVQLGDDSAASRVFRTGQPVRIDDYASLKGQVADTARSTGVRSVVAWPISLGGRLWGALTAGVIDEELPPPETESHLGQFTELMATAIANAEARGEVERLAEDQSALRRVATLVAEAAPPAEIFSAVSNEVATLFRTELVFVGKFDGDPVALLVVGVGDGMDEPVVGSRWKLDDALASTAVYRTGLPARFDHDSTIADPDVAAIVERLRPAATVAVPIRVEGKLWGAMNVSTQNALFPADTEERLQRFTDLIATALANAEAREALAQLADEQAARRRVAMLVAQDTAPAEIFAAVSAEVDRVFGLDPATFDVAVVGRFEPGPELVIVGISKSVDVGPLGSRWPPDDLFAPTHVLRTGRSARIRADDVVSAGGEVAELLRHSGYLSQVASPIVVDGRLWGAMLVTTRSDLPPDTEERLAQFTELVATAIANAETREDLANLAD